jgi:L-seryl-tRNA(Ser) seleniumtransferase
MIAKQERELRQVARSWATTLRAAGLDVEVRKGLSAVGGGALPGETLPTWLLALPAVHPDTWAAALRRHRPSVILRIEDNHLLVDPRTILESQERPLLDALITTGAGQGGKR